MNTLLLGLFGALLSSNPPAAISNLIAQKTGVAITTLSTNAAADLEIKKLEAEDDAALEEIDKWIVENEKFKAEGAGLSNEELNARIMKRLDVVRKAYDGFIARNPGHAEGRLAYASFLSDIGEEHAALVHLEKARELAPSNPAVWNNLANYYGHNGELTNAFTFYEKAISLNPEEPVYYHNFGTTVFLFRKDAREFYNITEQQVFDKAMALYSNSMRLDPTNFLLATDVAHSYYGIKPLRTNDALQAWTNAMKLATTDVEREGVQIHLARVKILAGSYSEARPHLNAVTNAFYADLKARVLRNLNEREAGTNAVAEMSDPPIPGRLGSNGSKHEPPKPNGARR